jgi:hypothetical protein
MYAVQQLHFTKLHIFVRKATSPAGVYYCRLLTSLIRRKAHLLFSLGLKQLAVG